MGLSRRGLFWIAAALFGGAGVAGWAARERLRPVWVPLWSKIRGRRSVAEVMADEGARGLARLAPALARAGFADAPPDALRLIGLKDERRLEVWGRGGDAWRFIADYPVKAASGGPGPKLREGDRQVPEGVYAAGYLNPNSAFHLSIQVAYPNAADRAQAAEGGRTALGGDIMIHGRASSIGCLAIGDDAIEEVFALTATAGLARTTIVIAPVDLRLRTATDARPWVAERYAALRALLRADHMRPLSDPPA